jgi:hypothetical protein
MIWLPLIFESDYPSERSPRIHVQQRRGPPHLGNSSIPFPDSLLAITCVRVIAISRFSGRWFLSHAFQPLG